MLEKLRGVDWHELGPFMFAFAWLVFLAFPLGDAIVHGDAGYAAGSIVAASGFVLVYAWFWLRVRSRPVAAGTGVAVAGLLAITVPLALARADAWGYLFIYVLVVAGAGLEGRRAIATVAGIVLLVMALSLLELQGVYFTLGVGLELGLMAAGTIAISRLIHTNFQLGAAREEIARLAVSEERLRFARDLHDLLGHSLSVIVLKAELATRLGSAQPERATAEVEDIERVAREALREVREAVAQVDRGDQVLEAALRSLPDVALLDIEMPGQDGIRAAEELRDRLPGCRVLMLTTFGRPGYLRRAMESGASGFLLKDAPAAQLAGAVRRTAAGERVVDPDLAATALAEGRSPLSDREAQVLRASAEGASAADLARGLFLSEGTVRNHLSAAIQKLNARNRAEAAKIAEEKGWL